MSEISPDPAEIEEKSATGCHRFSSASCLIPASFDADAVTQAARGCLSNLGADPKLVIAFVSSDYRSHLPELIEILQIDGHATSIVGTSAGGLLGVKTEYENAFGISLLFLKFPDASHRVIPDLPELRGKKSSKESASGFLVFGNPLKTDLGPDLARLNTEFPGVPATGGMITGGPDEDGLFLFTDRGISNSPSIAVQFNSPVKFAPLVSQGCRPIGDPFVVTGTTSDDVVTIGRRRAFSVLEDTFEALPEELQAEADKSIFAGLAVSEEVDVFRTGHFLIRHILSANLKKGWLQLATTPRIGQTMQFQLRDSRASEACLIQRCKELKKEFGSPFAGIFCIGQGRGRKHYGAEDRDARIVEEHLGMFPLAGIFSNGEAGPVSGCNFRHDYTLCGALFYGDETGS